MRALLQRVSAASVDVAGERIGEIGIGLLALVAAGAGDAEPDAVRLARKIAGLRVFGDADGRMNRSLADVGGSVLCVSQFTLYADTRRGNRPGFTAAAPAEEGRRLVDRVASELRSLGLPVETGRFGAEMRVSLVNEGPVTIWLDTADW
ncbi:MAG: D-aminoacyl-tRNA deacylase [Gaiellales bacterium]|jgi:D-tyrosyl-tRNA(Tyr) deacylase|nr:D-aminoacyl-tRNA deacylase [Gaiellales bacterium]